MNNPAIKGIITPIITPMNPDESVNLPELRNQIERQIAGGVHQHAPHAAVQAVWMGAEMGQQVIEPAVHAALIQGDDKQEPPSRQRTLQAG